MDKQIIERLKTDLDFERSKRKTLQSELTAKEQKCEELKKFLNEGCLHNLTLMTEQRVLLQTLAEIKEIAEHCMKQDICTTCDNSEKCHIEDEEIPTYDVCKLILQKISEVTND